MGFFTLAVVMLALLGASMFLVAGPAHAQQQNYFGFTSQVGLTASYSVIGGSASQVKDIFTFVSNGVQQVVPLTGTPTVYMVDSGSQWSAQTILNGSTNTERWLTSQDVSGTISSPLTVSFSYYHQYLVTFTYSVVNGGAGYSGPAVTFNQMGSGTASTAPETAWVDASSPYSVGSQLPGSSPSERWTLQSGGSGSINGSQKLSFTYFHQYLVSTSYSVVNGGSPASPSLSSKAFNSSAVVTLTPGTQTTWLDAGASYSWTAQMASSSNQEWIGTVLVQTQSGNALSRYNNGTVNSALSITPAYYHLVLVNVNFAFVGGSIGSLTPPSITYQYFGARASDANDTAVWVDSGTQYTLPETVCCPTSPGTERWELNNQTTGTLPAPTTISSTYFHQFMDSFSYSIVGQQPPSPSGQPGLTYVAEGNDQQLTLLQTQQSVWGDAGSAYSVSSQLPASTGSERWSPPSSTGLIIGPAPDTSVNIPYTQQYLLTIVGGGLQSQWVNAANNATLSTPGVYGRSHGTGFRVTSYQLDQGAVVTLAQPTALLTVQLSMDAPHTLTFKSVTQFQVSLDTGASAALYSISPPTVPGDDFWYDTGSPVQLVLNGAWGRANGLGERLTSISATAEPTIRVDTIGTVQAYSTAAIQTPLSVATTSTSQYEVVLNRAALAAFASITPASSFPNDTFWYDSGSPAVTVVLDGAYARSAGTGIRVSSWEIDGGAVTRVASTGPITVVTAPMTSAHFLNATSVAQYQITIDKGGSSALYSMTSPSIPGDPGWYDSSTPVGVIMNGVWGRSSGTGQRLAGFSLNGGPVKPVASSGLVPVLNFTAVSSPVAVSTVIVTQYQVTLDSGAVTALGSITATPIPKDVYWFDGGSQVNVSLQGVWGRTSTSGSRLTSYSVNQGAATPVLASAQVQVLSLSAISGPETISTKTTSQYRLASSPEAWTSLTNSTIPGDAPAWFDSGAVVKAVYDSAWGQTSTGSRSSVTSYSVDGGGKTNVARTGTGTFAVTLTMASAHSIVVTSVTQYQLTIVGPAQTTASPPSPTGDSYFDSGAKVTLTVPRVWNASSQAGERDVLSSYSLDSGTTTAIPASTSSTTFTTPSMTFDAPHALVFNAALQYQVAFKFFDGLGKDQVTPSDVQIGIGNSTVDVQGQPAWLANGTTFSVVDVIWEGSSVGPTPPPSFTVDEAPLNVTLDTRVYAASLKVVDLFGLPVSGAQVSMTLSNGTTVTGTTKADGTFSVPAIPFGTFTAKVSSLGTSAHVVGNAATSQQAVEGRVTFSLISLATIVGVIVAAGTAGVLVLRRVRRPKASGAQVSEQK